MPSKDRSETSVLREGRGNEVITLTKGEAIELLKALEGVKRVLQAKLKTK